MMDIKVPDKIRERERQAREAEVKGLELSEKIAELIAAENVTVDIAERALRRAEVIVRARTEVRFTRL